MVLCSRLPKQTQEILFPFLLKSPGTRTRTHVFLTLSGNTFCVQRATLALKNYMSPKLSRHKCSHSIQEHHCCLWPGSSDSCNLLFNPTCGGSNIKPAHRFFSPHFWRKGHIDFRCQKDGLCRISVWGRRWIGPFVWLTGKRLREREASDHLRGFITGLGWQNHQRRSLCAVWEAGWHAVNATCWEQVTGEGDSGELGVVWVSSAVDRIN